MIVDYILIVQKDVDIAPVANEVRDTKWVSRAALEEFLKEDLVSPYLTTSASFSCTHI